jgi:small subunit ribosomal protein S7
VVLISRRARQGPSGVRYHIVRGTLDTPGRCQTHAGQKQIWRKETQGRCCGKGHGQKEIGILSAALAMRGFIIYKPRIGAYGRTVAFEYRDEFHLHNEGWGRNVPRRGNIAKRDVLARSPCMVSQMGHQTYQQHHVRLEKRRCPKDLFTMHFDIVKEKTGKDPLEALSRLLRTSCRIGGKKPAVMAVPPTRLPMGSASRTASDARASLADKQCRATVPSAPCKNSWPGEIMDALNSNGLAFKKREDVPQNGRCQQGIAHYRW